MIRIISVGCAVPSRVVTNAELESQLCLEEGWIERRTGIRARRYAAPEEACSDLAVLSARAALNRAGPLATPVGMLLLATSTPDHHLPPTAPLVAHRLGLTACGAIDLGGACTGFITALALGHAYALARQSSVIVVAANVLSRRINPTDPATAALFGDGAGAMILSPDRSSSDAILAFHSATRGDLYDQLLIPAGGSRRPVTEEAIRENEHLMSMTRGPEVYREAVRATVRSATAVLDQTGLKASEIDWWIPHQANARIIRDAGERLGIGADRTISIVETLGNTSAASIPLAMAIAYEDGRFRGGQRLLFTAVGAGMTEASAVIQWPV